MVNQFHKACHKCHFSCYFMVSVTITGQSWLISNSRQEMFHEKKQFRKQLVESEVKQVHMTTGSQTLCSLAMIKIRVYLEHFSWHDRMYILNMFILRMYCIDTKALVFMYNGASSYGFAIHPISTRLCMLYLRASWLSGTPGLSMQYIPKPNSNLGYAFQILAQIKIEICQNTELDSNLNIWKRKCLA